VSTTIRKAQAQAHEARRAVLRAEQPARHPSPTAKATALAHLVFERPDLDRAEAFLADFGLRRVERTDARLSMRACSSAPYTHRLESGPEARFVGAGFAVASRAELERLSGIAGASAIERVDFPGGGERVRLRDPAGFVVEVVHGQAGAEPLPTRAAMPLNVGDARPRINGGQRPPIAPPELLRLGHVLIEVPRFQETCAWYTRHLGFIPSDVQVFDDGSAAVVFLRLDRGGTPTDHHTLAIVQGVMPRFGHAAYEVVDADAVGMGQRVLRDRGWRHAWGIGRHILGSQLFDYWNDPWGDKLEHYCDGDLFTADSPLGVHPVSAEAMAQWGQPMPRSFTSPRLGPAAIAEIVHHVRTSPDLTWAKLRTLMKLFG
jgi:catechol 2,3-dioxygenase-like lactoylglutathione lyase family enzyme